MTGARGAIAGLGSAGAGNTRLAKAATSQEAWPEVAPKTTKVPLARAAVERRQSCAPRKGRGRARRHGIIPIASVGVSPPNLFRSFPFVPFVIAGQSRPKDDIASLVYARQSMPKLRLRMLPPAFARCSSAWTTGSSPAATSKRQWLGIARALNRAARTNALDGNNAVGDEVGPY
jgi:hypothetical protein